MIQSHRVELKSHQIISNTVP